MQGNYESLLDNHDGMNDALEQLLGENEGLQASLGEKDEAYSGIAKEKAALEGAHDALGQEIIEHQNISYLCKIISFLIN